MPQPLDLNTVKQAVAGTAAAFRSITEYQPIGGTGDKVFPPTYEGGKYAVEERILPGYEDPVSCVLLNSVQSEANHMELALLDAWEDGRIELPVITVDFSDAKLEKDLRITSLEAPHRIADALLRDSQIDGTRFRDTPQGRQLDKVDLRNATPLFELCPTALLLGMWDSTGPKGGLGAKFARALVSEMVGINAVNGVTTGSRLDPAEIMTQAGPIFRRIDGGYTLDRDHPDIKTKPGDSNKLVLFKQVKKKDVYWDRVKDVGKEIPDAGKPSTLNHSNIVPALVYRKDVNGNVVPDAHGNPINVGGFTIAKAQRTTVISLPGLRRLRFPLNGAKSNGEVNQAARTVLATLGLLSTTLAWEGGTDLRSRCQLQAQNGITWELLDQPGQDPKVFRLSATQAVDLFAAAVSEAKKAGLPWMTEELVLKPSPELADLVRKSQKLKSNATADAGED